MESPWQEGITRLQVDNLYYIKIPEKVFYEHHYLEVKVTGMLRFLGMDCSFFEMNNVELQLIPSFKYNKEIFFR